MQCYNDGIIGKTALTTNSNFLNTQPQSGRSYIRGRTRWGTEELWFPLRERLTPPRRANPGTTPELYENSAYENAPLSKPDFLVFLPRRGCRDMQYFVGLISPWQ